jgi:hypothetical protein
LIGRKIWALVGVAILLAALIGGAWIASQPGAAPQGDSEPRDGQSLTAPPRALAPVGLEIGSDAGPGPYRLQIGEGLSLLAAVELEDGSTRYDAPIEWASTDPEIASIDSTGLLRARGRGEVTVTARLAPLAAQAEVRIGA